MHGGPTPSPEVDRHELRRHLLADRRGLADRPARMSRLEAVVGEWLAGRPELAIGAWWPIRGEPDLLPVLGRWAERSPARRVGLPVVEAATQRLRFRAWWPGCPMRPDAFGIPVPDGTAPVVPTLLLVPCLGFGPGGIRLGYGGGFYDRTLAAATPRPATAGIAFAGAFVAWLRAAPHDVPLDAILTEDGPAWP